MFRLKQIPAVLFLGLFIFSACTQRRTTTVPPASATASPLPSATATRLLPTPSSAGDSIIWEDLQVGMDKLEITQDYLTEFGSTRVPPAGQKFLWVHIQLKNLSQIQIDLPLAEHFSILYAAIELKPTYGHRQSYTDYTELESVIDPGQELDGWIRFDIPAAAELRDLRFVFLPESAQVGASYTSPNYPYATDKPTYVWNCGP